MIAGYFTANGLPYVRANVVLPRLSVAGLVHFLVDTGAVATVLHPDDGVRLSCPFDALVLPVAFAGVGGAHTYYRETAVVVFYDDDDMERTVHIELSIAKPHPLADGLDPLLGRDILNRLRMEYDFPLGHLE